VDASVLDVVDAMAPDTFVSPVDASGDAGRDAGDGACWVEPFGCFFDAGCPTTLPEAGSACDPAASPVTCDAPAPGTDQCLARFACGDAGWEIVDLPEAGTSCAYVLPAGCPATFAAAATEVGQTCGTQLTCSYSQGTCGCPPVFGVEAGPAAWTCISPAADSGCPVDVPQGGSACTGTPYCAYGYLCSELSGPVLYCDCCGRWVYAGHPPCPPG
jgi:hypothetical protein